MAHQGRRDKSSTLSLEGTDGAAALAAIGATARVKNASTSHNAPSHLNKGGQQRRSSKGHLPKISPSRTNKSSMPETENHKKKNKLDYTRSSVACTHCRRRKIRCVPDEKNPLAKCDKCIRFKKDCIFYPVDQQHLVAQHRAQASSGTRQSSSVASSPTDRGSDEHSYSGYATIAPHLPGGQQTVLQSLDSAPSTMGSTADPTGTMYPSNQAASPWQYHNSFQQSHHGLPSGPFPHQQYSQYINPISTTGDFSPYPVYSPTPGNVLYNNALSPYLKQEAAAMEVQMASSRSGEHWPSSGVGYPSSYMQPATAFSQPAFADPTYYSGTSDSRQAAEAEAWFSSYGSEEQ